MAEKAASAEHDGRVLGGDHVDVLIIGAGLSGIGAAHHLQGSHPGRTYAILEAREAIGGTWDLFRYPGVRSDSDMYTLGYVFKPWTEAKAIADGPSILNYVRETAREGRIEEHIRFNHRVISAEWSSEDALWTVHAERTDTGQALTMTASFVIACTGYYRYDQGYTPDLAGIERFKGRVVHPQLWSDDVDYDGKRVVVIGSGATAITLVPAMADRAAHVTMLQRSPTYVISFPRGGSDRQHPAPDASGEARLLDRAWEERARTAGDLPAQPPLARPGQEDAPRPGRAQAARGQRHRHALQTDIQPVGSTPVSRARRRPLRGDQLWARVGRHGPDRDVHRDRHQAQVGAPN